MRPDAVIKVGGSLLGWPDLPVRLASFLSMHAGERLLLIAGGGPAADVVRELDRAHGLGEERSHQLALRALDLTAHLLAALVRDLHVVDYETEFVPVWQSGYIPVLAPRRLLDEDDKESAEPLAHNWEVTSDAIAARVADRMHARALILLKSAPLLHGTSREDAARLGLVDPVFPAAARRIERVVYVNLRAPTIQSLRLDRSLDGGLFAG